MASFGTFWAGPRLSSFEAACLHSFIARDHRVTLFSFEHVGNVPAGVLTANAAELVAPSALKRFFIDGSPSISHFSDYFRYVMFSRTELTWVDTDVLLLRSFE